MRFCQSKVSKFEFKWRIKRYIAKNASLKADALTLQEQNAILQQQNSNLQQSASLKENETLRVANKELTFQKQLIAKLLSDKEPNLHLAQFRTLLYKDFLDFANKDDSLANEAEMILKLQNIEKELAVISACPQIYNKQIIAVAGSFSTGKSAFISSLFEDIKVSLPEKIEPSTAIATFVISEEKRELVGISNEGVRVNLSELDEDIHAKLAHDFIETFGFKLKKLMPFMVFQISLKEEFKPFCFIDTPGISAPASGEFTSDDEVSAKEFLKQVDAVLWFVSINAGTISQSDLKFLDGIDWKNKKLFIVLNKADLKPLNELNNIIQNIAQNLDENLIEFEGISAYSSAKSQEYAFEKMSLIDFLRNFNTKQNLQKELVTQLYEVFEAYKMAILEKEQKRKKIYNELNSFANALTEDGLDDEATFARLAQIKSYFADDKALSSLKILESVVQRMKAVINAIFGKYFDISLPDLSKAVEKPDKTAIIKKKQSKTNDSKQQKDKIKLLNARKGNFDNKKLKNNLSKEYKLEVILKDAFNGLYGETDEAMLQLVAQTFDIDIKEVKEMFETIIDNAYDGLYGEIQDDDKAIQQLAKAFNELYEAKISKNAKQQKEQQ